MKRKINNTRSPIKINSPLYESGKKSSSCNKYSYNYSTAHQTKTPREGSTNSSHHNSPNIVKFQELRTSKISDILDPTDKREEYYSFKQHIPKTPKQILSLCKKHEGE